MKISDYAKAQGWLKRHASSENSAGEWEKYVALNTTPELDIAIKTINDKYGPGTVFPASEAPIPPKTLDRDMWESANERLGFNDGQLVTPSVDGSRPGYAKKKGSNWKSRYKIKAFDEVADLLLQTYAKDDIDIIYKIGKETENKLRYVGGDQELIDYISNKTKDKGFRLSEKDIFDILDDRKAHSELMKDIKVQEGKAKFDKPRKDLNNKMRNWLMTNSKKYADPEKFEKSFNRVFGKNNYIAKGIRKNHPSASVVGFVDENFVKTYLSDKVKPNLIDEFPFSSNQLKNMFKTLIYNNNENVRNKVVQTFSDILPKEKIKKTEAYSVYKAMKNNEFLKKFNLNKGIQGPVARLIANKLDEKLVSQIENFQNPWLGSRELLNYLGDHVDPKYKSMFKEAEKAVLAMQSDNWSKARSYLDTGREIMFDHKIPSSLIEAGYADEIEYIKMNPTSKEFNVKIKSKQFDAPMNRLAEKFEKAKTLDAKTKIYEEMVAKKDAFSKKYGNYLDEVDIKFDKKTGKLRFTSDAPVVTKKTDLTKMLEKSLQQEKFPTMSNKEQIKFLNDIQANSKLDECRLDSADGGRIGFAYSNKCIKDGLEETKKKAAAGDKKAARQLVKTAEAATKFRLLKNVLGPGAILGDAVFEGALIGNKVLGGKPLKQAWAESYLSYLDPRKYRGELDPMLMERDRLLTRTINDKIIDGPNANLLRAGFAAQDQLSAANKAVEDRDLAARVGKNIRYAPAAADAREQGARANLSAKIISDEAFKDASKQAREYLDAQEGKRRFDLGVLSVPQSAQADRRRRLEAIREMNELFPNYGNKEIDDILAYYGEKKPDHVTYDQISDFFKDEDKTRYFADNFRMEKAGGGLANLTDTIPPESGPMSQGLRSLYNNDMDY
jgi:hypothetical protein